MSEFNFEKTLQELEKTVELLEKGDIPLQDAMKEYEKGITLSKQCAEFLENSKQKILNLSEIENGESND